MSLLSARLDNGHRLLKIAYEDVIIVLATWGVLNVWRGEWDLLKEYFLPDQFIGGWVCHWIGTVGLMLLQGFANVGTNGIDIDGSYQNGEAIFPTDFLRPLVIDKSNSTKKKEKVILRQYFKVRPNTKKYMVCILIATPPVNVEQPLFQKQSNCLYRCGA